MKLMNKIKARIIANYIIKQIKKISKTDTLNVYLHVTETIKKTKYIYVKFNIMNGIKDIDMNFIEYCKSQRKIENKLIFTPKKSIFNYWNIYKKRLPRKFYKYLNLLSKRYNFYEPKKIRQLAIMVMDNISNSSYELFDGSFVYNTYINTGINSYKITLNLI